MIGKKVSNPKGSSSKAARVGGLVDYIDEPERSNDHEKCIYSEGRGFLSDTHEGRKAEMIALAQEAVRSHDPINHYVLSWREGEQPTHQNVEQAVDILLDELGLKGHQCVYGLHADTDNIHLHIAVNRVHPDSLKVIKPNKGFDIEAVHKAVARIEHAQGWEREKNGRYQVLENGDLGRARNDAGKQRQPEQRKQDMENRTGEKSKERIAIEQAAPIIKAASNWREVHDKLAEKGMRYERTGSGAIVFVGDVGVKASRVDRAASFGNLQKRLGPYEPSTQEKPNVYHRHDAGEEPHLGHLRNLTEHRLRDLSECRLAHHGSEKTEGVLSHDARAHRREFDAMRRQSGPASQLVSEPVKESLPGWTEYIAGRKAHYAARDVATRAQKARQEAERMALAASQKAQRAELLGGSWKGKGQTLNALRSMAAAAQAVEKISLRERQESEREQLGREYPPYPDLEQWQRQQKCPELADAWRHRNSEPMRIEGDHGDRAGRGGLAEPAQPRDLRAYIAEIHGEHVHYTRKDQDGGGRGGDVSFVDKGDEIDIYDWRNRDSVLAALQLSAQKWDSLRVIGNDDYKAMCASLAAEHDFKISNPELRERIAQERQQHQQERAQAMKSEPLRQFEQYHAAVGAERYRVTSIRMREDGSRQVFILDKREGVTRGFTADEIVRRTPEMQRLQRRGENLYYTPLSDTKHHILIDDMSREKLEKLIAEGYRPAVVLESSAGNYQAIITVQKLGTAHDKDVGNRITECLNKEYGDPKLSGCIHPHRAPGFENRKLKHRREDGSYPLVRLLKSEGRECGKTLALSGQIDAEYQRHGEQKARQPERLSALSFEKAAVGGAIDAYQRHHQDVVMRHKGVLDLSRVDSMIAVRMRVTGHSQADIEGALRQCAPAARHKDEGRDWNDYAKRTASYAFGAAGERQAADLGKYRMQWGKLEGREQSQERTLEQNQNQNQECGRGMSR
jgi:hypothetical protein